MVHRPERLVDIMYFMRKYKIEPKEIRYVYPKFGEKSNLVLIKGVKNANEFLKMDKPLIIYDTNGNYTNEILKIYNKI
jgi:tRNA1Val (adenine37-N6)-methyltransferase